MKKLLLLLLLTPAITFLKAQSGTETPKDEVIKEWAFLGESRTQLDISYRLVLCAGKGQVHLQIFNENPQAQVARFNIEIVNADGLKFTKEVSFAVEKAAIVQAACNGETSLDDLKISIPANYDIRNLKVKISFK
jgi:hypothetical protein